MFGRMTPPAYSVPPALPIAGMGIMTPWGNVQRYQEATWSPDELMRGRMEVLARERALGLGPGDVLGSFASAALGSVSRIDVESQIAPTVSYDPNAPGVPPSQGDSWFMRSVAKPRVTFYGRGGNVIARYAPYGEPSPGLFVPFEVAAGIGAGAFAAWTLYRAFTKPARVQNPRKRRYHARRRARRAA
jgi:hypothetical protein